MLLPTMLGSFHFYENKTLSEYGIETLLPTMLGSFHFYSANKARRCSTIKRYYPLCWALFISTELKSSLPNMKFVLLPTMLGSFHFYGTPSEAQ